MTLLRAILVLLFLNTVAFAQQSAGPVSQMPFASTPLNGTELLYIVQSGASKKITSQSLVDFGPCALGGCMPHVSNLTALIGYIPQFATSIIRDGYATPGDGGDGLYASEAQSCEVRGLANDGGYCVDSNVTSGSWQLSVPKEGLSVKMYGAPCNGMSSDSVQFLAALHAWRYVTVPPNLICLVRNLQISTNQILECNGSQLQAVAGGLGPVVLVGTFTGGGQGYNVRLHHCTVTDPNNLTLGFATLTSNATPGSTTIQVSSAFNFAVGNAVKIELNGVTSPVTEHVTKIMGITGTGPYTLTLKDPIPYVVTGAVVNAPGTNCAAGLNLAINGGAGPPGEINVATVTGGGAATLTVVLPGLYDTSPGTTGVALSSVSATVCVGTTANLTYATNSAAIGANVYSAYGVVVEDQCVFCIIEDLNIAASPLGLQIQDTGTGTNLSPFTTRDIIQNVQITDTVIAGFYRNAGVSESHFLHMDIITGTSFGSGVSIYNDGRDYGSAAPGGNIWISVNAESAQTCWLQRSVQLDFFDNTVGDTCGMYNTIMTGGVDVNYGVHWESFSGPSGSNGVNMYLGESPEAPGLGNLFTQFGFMNLFLDSTVDGVRLNDDSWGPTRGLFGGGCYNCTANTGAAAAVVGAVKSIGNGRFTQAACSDLLGSTGLCSAPYTAPTAFTPVDNSGAGLTFTAISTEYWVQGNTISVALTLTYPTTADTSHADITLPVATPNAQYALAPSLCYLQGVTPTFTTMFVPLANALSGVFLNGATSAALTNANLSTAIVHCLIAYPRQ